MTEPNHHPVPRLGLWLLGAAVLLAGAVVVDCVLYALFGEQQIKGMDYLFLSLGVLFLICCVLQRKRAVKWAMTFLAVAVMFTVVEVSLSLLSPSGDRAFAQYVRPPNYSILLQPHGLPGVAPKGTFTTNSLGIRGPEFSDADRVRILCVGGSSTECLYLDDSKAWPKLLGDMLAPDVWVGNVGRSGRTALDHYTLLANLPEADRVEYWIVHCGINDLGQRLRGTYEQNARHTWHKTFTYRRPGFGGGPLRRPYHRNLHLFRFLERFRKRLKMRIKHGAGAEVHQDDRAIWIGERRKHRRSSRQDRPLPQMQAFLDNYEGSLMWIVALARKRGKTLVFATQPAMWSENMTEQDRDLCLGTQAPNGDYYRFDGLARGMAQFNQRMRDVARREGVECVDLAAVVPGSTKAMYDDCHFNENGARIVAEELARVLRPTIEKTTAPRIGLHTTAAP